MPPELFDIDAIQVSGFLDAAIPIIFYVALGLFALFGGILDYHWRKYSYNLGALFLFRIFFFGGGILILLFISFAQSSY
jgi:hypothetical protein